MKISLPKNVERDMKKLTDWHNSLEKVTIKEIIELMKELKRYIYFRLAMA